jgi:hypothetical protein
MKKSSSPLERWPVFLFSKLLHPTTHRFLRPPQRERRREDGRGTCKMVLSGDCATLQGPISPLVSLGVSCPIGWVDRQKVKIIASFKWRVGLPNTWCLWCDVGRMASASIDRSPYFFEGVTDILVLARTMFDTLHAIDYASPVDPPVSDSCFFLICLLF